MKILLTNDDGYLALGIRAVFMQLIAAGHEVILIAPDRNSSGAGQSIAVYNPFSITQVAQNIYFVNSTPADSVRLGLQAVYGARENYPDLVVSGVNLGENIAEDVLYSGTVGAAREAALHGIPALAFSTNSPAGSSSHNEFDHLDSAALVVNDLVDRVAKNLAKLEVPFIWNINIPNRPYAEINGYETTRLGMRPQHQELVKQVTPRHREIYWQGLASEPEMAELGTDLSVYLNQKKVSITPIEVLPTNYSQMPAIDELTS